MLTRYEAAAGFDLSAAEETVIPAGGKAEILSQLIFDAAWAISCYLAWDSPAEHRVIMRGRREDRPVYCHSGGEVCPRVCPLHMFAHVFGASFGVTRSDIRSDADLRWRHYWKQGWGSGRGAWSVVCGQGTYARVAPRSGLAVKKMTLGITTPLT